MKTWKPQGRPRKFYVTRASFNNLYTPATYILHASTMQEASVIARDQNGIRGMVKIYDEEHHQTEYFQL